MDVQRWQIRLLRHATDGRQELLLLRAAARDRRAAHRRARRGGPGGPWRGHLDLGGAAEQPRAHTSPARRRGPDDLELPQVGLRRLVEAPPGIAIITTLRRIAIITTLNIIAIITTINRIAIITTINRIAIITTINRIAIITTINRIAILLIE